MPRPFSWLAAAFQLGRLRAAQIDQRVFREWQQFRHRRGRSGLADRQRVVVLAQLRAHGDDVGVNGDGLVEDDHRRGWEQ